MKETRIRPKLESGDRRGRRGTRRYRTLALRLALVALLSSLTGPAGRAEDSSRSPVLLGAYYYPWYSGEPDEKKRGWMKQALRGRLEPRQLPRLGVYDSRDPKVIEDHIAQSRRAEIDFWTVSWWGPGRREDRALRESILPHRDAAKLKYAVLYESTGRFGSFDDPDFSHLVPDFEYLAKTYFEHPQYLKIDDRPVVFIYLTRAYFRGRGLESLAELRRRFPKLYLVGDEVFGPRCRERDVKQWDAVTAYDVYGQSLQRLGATQSALDHLKANYERAKRIANGAGKAFVPAIGPGFNDRAVREGHVGRARAFTDRPDSKEGDVFREMIRQIATPLADERAQRMVMVTSFNEWYEDTQIEATSGRGGITRRDDSESGRFYTEGEAYADYGTLYLDILREELGNRSKEPAKDSASAR